MHVTECPTEEKLRHAAGPLKTQRKTYIITLFFARHVAKEETCQGDFKAYAPPSSLGKRGFREATEASPNLLQQMTIA